MSKIGINATLHTIVESRKALNEIATEQERLMCRLKLELQKLETCRMVLEQMILQNPEILKVSAVEIP